MRIKMLVVAGLATGCTAEGLELRETQQEITLGALASPWQQARALRVDKGCTATRISSRWALTAAHCAMVPYDPAEFYTSGTLVTDLGIDNVDIVEVVRRPGVVLGVNCGNGGDCIDGAGDLADVALLRLDAGPYGATVAEAALEGPAAVLAWSYPGDNEVGQKVGAGNHDEFDNPYGLLMQATDSTKSEEIEDGKFLTHVDQTNGGDSGGPFYFEQRVLGVLRGSSNDDNVYTAVPTHLNWILETIGYRWMGQPPQANTSYSGDEIEEFFGHERECQYACEKTESCQAYDWVADSTTPSLGWCALQGDVYGVSTVNGSRGALKHGARSANSGAAVGYVRNDGKDVVVHAWGDQLHEMWRSPGGWTVNSIQGGAPAVGSALSAYRRSDGYDAVVYRSTANRIIERSLSPSGTWWTKDWTDLADAPNASGNPVGYVRGDGVNAVVYRTTAGNVYELRHGTSWWLKTNLSDAVGGVYATGDVHAWVRADGRNSVVFRSGSVVYELSQLDDGIWWSVPISELAGAPDAIGRPFGYSHSDGTRAIVYRAITGILVEVFVSGGSYQWGAVGYGAANDPVAYVRTDGKEAVVYRHADGHVRESVLDGTWQTYNLGTVTGAPVALTAPSTYHRSDGFQCVLYEASADHVMELSFKRGGVWNDNDLSIVSGEAP